MKRLIKIVTFFIGMLAVIFVIATLFAFLAFIETKNQEWLLVAVCNGASSVLLFVLHDLRKNRENI